MPEPENKPDPKVDDPDAGAKKALEAERKLRRDAEAETKAEKAKVADLEKRLGAIETGDKGDSEKLTEQLATLQKDLDEERVKRLTAEVAAEKKLGVRAKYLKGSTKEELEEAADALLEDFPDPEPGDGEAGQAGSGTGQQPPPASQRPKERLKAGTGTGDDDTPDPTLDVKKLGASMFGDA